MLRRRFEWLLFDNMGLGLIYGLILDIIHMGWINLVMIEFRKMK